MHAQTMRENWLKMSLFARVESNGGVGVSKLNSFLVFKCSIGWWKPHLFIPSSHSNLWLGPVWCMHAQTVREVAENGVLFDGVESNGGVRASRFDQWLAFVSSIEWWKPHLFIPSSRFNPWLGPVWWMHAQTMRKWLKMASFSMVYSQMEELWRQIKIND